MSSERAPGIRLQRRAQVVHAPIMPARGDHYAWGMASARSPFPPNMLPRDGRFGSGPSKIRDAQLDALPRRPARGSSAPRTARRPSRTSWATCGRCSPNSSRFPTATRSSSRTAAPRSSGMRRPSAWCGRAPSTARSASSARSSPASPRPPLTSTTPASSRPTPDRSRCPVAEDGDRRLRVAPQRDVDGRDGARRAARGDRGRPRRRRRHLRGGRGRGGRLADGRLLLRAAEELRVRRRAVVRPRVARGASHASRRSPPPGGTSPPPCRFAEAVEQLARRTRPLNTPAIATLVLMRAQLEWLLDNGGMAWADARTRESSGFLYEWADDSDYLEAFVTNPSHRSTRRNYVGPRRAR